jgi:hypothetical protein
MLVIRDWASLDSIREPDHQDARLPFEIISGGFLMPHSGYRVHSVRG